MSLLVALTLVIELLVSAWLLSLASRIVFVPKIFPFFVVEFFRTKVSLYCIGDWRRAGEWVPVVAMVLSADSVTGLCKSWLVLSPFELILQANISLLDLTIAGLKSMKFLESISLMMFKLLVPVIKIYYYIKTQNYIIIYSVWIKKMCWIHPIFRIWRI